MLALCGTSCPWEVRGPVPQPSPKPRVKPAVPPGSPGLVAIGGPLPSDFWGGTCRSLCAERPQGRPRLSPCPVPHPLSGAAGTAVSAARTLGPAVPERRSLGWPGAVPPSQGRAGVGLLHLGT